ncbi:MAG: M36 family metallopeptidase [Saprospiraceae bacterium]|nr:M36 family metallopeptidase [Saprospiraceae bacterium]
MIKRCLFVLNVFCSAFAFGQTETTFRPFLDTAFSGQAPEYRVTHQHLSRISGVLHTYLTQQMEGRDICNLHGSVHVSQDGELIAMHHNFIANAQVLKSAANIQFADARAVIRLIGSELGVTLNSIEIDSSSYPSRLTILANELGSDTIVMEEVWFMRNKILIPAWQIFLNTGEAWWDWRIDATTGETLEKINWVSSCQFDHAHIPHHQNAHEQCVPTLLTNGYTVFPTGVESPIHGNRIAVTDPSDSLASPYGWHDTNGLPGPEFTKTSGNNVEAKEDIAGNNETTIGAFAEGGSNLEFNFPLNLTTALRPIKMHP